VLAELPKNRTGPTTLWRGHLFDRVCAEHGIEHRLTKPNHPWMNGQVERMHRTLKQATVHRYHYGSHAQLKQRLHAFLMAYNFAKHASLPGKQYSLLAERLRRQVAPSYRHTNESTGGFSVLPRFIGSSHAQLSHYPIVDPRARCFPSGINE
jgi:hypothetical protein